MTGMRSWTAEVTAFGAVVRIEQDLTHCPLGSFQRSQSPSNANNSPSPTSKQYGCLALPVRHPLVKPVCWNQAPPRFQRIAERGLRVRCFDLALIIPSATDGSVAQEGMSPQSERIFVLIV
jgi:hypothetical protein